MNVFFIPSWYPTEDNPLAGIFVKDQALAIARHHPDINIGISLWGSHVNDLLLTKKAGFNNFLKLTKRKEYKPYQHRHSSNLIEYFHPAYTWTRSIRDGNIGNIIKANLANLEAFQNEFGTVQLIHAHMGHPGGYIAHKISEKLKTPYLVTEQMSPFPLPIYLTRQGKLQHWLQEAYHHSQCNIAVGSRQMRTMEQFGIKKLRVIPNLVDEAFFKPWETKETRDPFTFFALGRLESQKGFEYLLRAIPKVLLHDEVKIHIGGDGSLANPLARLAEQLGISKYVTWLGALDRKGALQYFQKCDAFVLSSLHESFGIVLAEALSCGKPIVTTRCGGPEDILSEVDGLAAQPGDVDDLAEKMIMMLQNHHTYDPVIIRERFEARFSSKAVSAQITSIYADILN